MHSKSAAQAPKEPPVNLREVRAAFILRGESLHGWSRRNGLANPFVDQALRGTRRGPKARMIVEMVKRELAS